LVFCFVESTKSIYFGHGQKQKRNYFLFLVGGLVVLASGGLNNSDGSREAGEAASAADVEDLGVVLAVVGLGVAGEDEKSELEVVGDDGPLVLAGGGADGRNVEDPVRRVDAGTVESDGKTAGVLRGLGLVGVAGDVADVAVDGVLALPVEDADVAGDGVDGAVGGSGAVAVVGEGVEDDGVAVHLVPKSEVGRDVKRRDGGGPVLELGGVLDDAVLGEDAERSG